MKYLFLSLSLLIGIAECSKSQPAHSDDIRRNIDAFMERLEEQGFSGGLIVAVKGDVILAKGYGFADRAAEAPFTVSTIFPVGSITKQFTGAAILKLETMNKLDVTDPLSKYLEGIPDDKQSITLHHLLTHSAGFPAALGFDFKEIGRDEYIQLAMDAELEFGPGMEYEYSNVGYSLLAAIIEQVSGQSYSQFVREHLFEPAGLESTGYNFHQLDTTLLAHGYKGDSDWGTFADKTWDTDGPFWHLRGNGGMLSTLTDMYKWHNALLGTDVLSEDAKEKLFARHQREGRGAQSYYGYGWSIETTGHGELIAHDGGNPYFSSNFRRYVDADVMIFVTSNTSEHKAYDIAPALARIAFGEAVQPREQHEEVTLTDIENHAAGSRTLAVLEMFRGDVSDLPAWIHEHMSPRLLERFPATDLEEAFREDQRRFGNVEIHSVTANSDFELNLIVQLVRNSEWRELTITVDEAEPHHIIGIGVDEAMNPGQ